MTGGRRARLVDAPNPVSFGKGTTGVSTNGVTGFVCLLTEGSFGYSRSPTFTFPKCQGVPFSPSCQIHYFCSGPISVGPICPQPRAASNKGNTGCPSSLHSKVMQRGDPTWHLSDVAANVRHLVTFAHASNKHNFNFSQG